MHENRASLEDDRIAILEANLAQAKLIAEEADKKYEEVKCSQKHLSTTMTPTLYPSTFSFHL